MSEPGTLSIVRCTDPYQFCPLEKDNVGSLVTLCQKKTKTFDNRTVTSTFTVAQCNQKQTIIVEFEMLISSSSIGTTTLAGYGLLNYR